MCQRTCIRAPSLVWVAILGAAFLACSDDGAGLQQAPADGFFSPAQVDFGTVNLGSAEQQTVRLFNDSQDIIALQSLEFQPAFNSFVVRTPDGGSIRGRTLGRGGSIDLTLTFGPAEATEYSTVLVLETDDLRVELPVTGNGHEILPPRFEGPATLQFPAPVELGGQATLPFGITNQGERAGRIDRVSVETPFEVTGPNRAAIASLGDIGPGERQALELHVRPERAGALRGRLTITEAEGAALSIEVLAEAVVPGRLTCAPDRIELGAVARGEPASVPVVCTVDGGPYRLAALELLPATAPFTISDVPFDPTIPLRTVRFDVSFDATGLPGRRTATVQLRAGHGTLTSLAVTATLTAPAPEDVALHARLEWTADVDLDLHLTHADTAPFTPGADCHWNDNNPDWNTPGDPNDDPYLDEDARRGPGQEIINLGPAATGTYELWVQYFDPNGGAPTAPIDLTLSWTLDGTVTGQRTKTLQPCGQMWHAGQVILGANPRFVPVDQVSNAFAGFTFVCGP